MPAWLTATPSIRIPRWWSATNPRRAGQGYQARELGVPVVSDADFMDSVNAVVQGTGVDEFAPNANEGQQFALF